MHLKHTGSASNITNHVGDLTIQNDTNDGDIIFKTSTGSDAAAEYFRVDGGEGRLVYSVNSRYLDNVVAMFGSGADLQISHDSTDSKIANTTGNLILQNNKEDKDIIFKGDDGQASDNTIATYFFLDGSSATYDSGATTALYTNWPDKSRISLGSSHDLQIFHDGSNSRINETGTGNLIIQATNYQLLKGDGGEFIMQGIADAEVSLYYDGSKKFETTSTGVAVTGDVNLTNTSNHSINSIVNLILNADSDSNSGDSFRNIIFQNRGTETGRIDKDGNATFAGDIGVTKGNAIISASESGGATTRIMGASVGRVGTSSNHNLEVQTNSTAAITIDTSQNATFASKVQFTSSADYIDVISGDLYIVAGSGKKNILYSNNTESLRLDESQNATFAGDVKLAATKKLYLDGGTHTYITESSADTLQIVTAGTVTAEFAGTGLSLRNTQVNGTLTVGVNDTGHDVKFFGATAGSFLLWDESDDSLNLTDSTKLKIGDSADLEIYHDGSNSYIKDTGTGVLNIQGSTVLNIGGTNGEVGIQYTENAGVTLRHNNVVKFGTDSTGVSVTGSLTPSLGVTKPIASAAANVAAAVAGSIYTFSDADGAIVTLPDSGGGGLVGQTFEFVCTATATSNSHKVIFSDTTNEKFIGRLTAIDTDTDNAQLVYVPATANKAIVMNGTTTGITGSRFTITNVAADVWMIEGYVHHTGNTANPFANS
jgi:hypothetical protein